VPIYEFNCAKCGKLTEVVQRVGQRPPPCPHCGSKRMTRAVSRTSFHLKGGGWYADLYATPRPGADKPGGAEKAGEVEKVTPAEQKPATPAKPEGTGKPPAAPASEPVAKAEAAPRPATDPPRRRPSSRGRRR
jgi:putative FmdB family regulatory protein